jgi:hypothetical protein
MKGDMKMKYTMKYALIAALTLSIGTSCTSSYDDINTNHHEATDDMLDTDNLRVGAFFSQMEERVVLFDDGTGKALSSDYQVAQGLSNDLFSGYIGPTGTWKNGKHNGSYYFVNGWYNQMFTRGFSEVMPAWQKINTVAKTLNLTQASALADIVKVEAMHRVADTYGPIPYVNFGSGTLGSTYDKLEDVYAKFFTELDNAIDVLTTYAQANPSATLLQDYDFVYDGNVTSWVKFANTLRLRLAMRVVYANPTLAQQEAEKSIQNPIGVIEKSGERAVLSHTKLNYFHPNYDIAYNFNAGEIRMSASMDSYMNGYKDPRLSAYFVAAKSDAAYHGVRLGVMNINASKYAGDKISNLNIDKSTTPIVWMTAAESYFLRAEGALRGWNMGGTAKKFYEDGIKMSFSENGVGGADSYIADNSSKPADFKDNTGDNNDIAARSTITIAYDESADFETNLERIITQKWIAMYPDGPEGWSEFRRTGYPKLFPVVTNNSNGTIDTEIQVRRCPFPTTEYNTNPAAVQTGVTALGGADNGGTKLWWDKK